MSLRDLFKYVSLKKSHSIFSASLVLGITFGLSAILGFLRSRFLYAQFFNCCVLELDAYNAAFRLPDLIFKLLVTGALSASFIPVFSSYLHKDEHKAYEVASSVINLLLIVFTLASLLVLIFAKPLSGIIAHGFTPEQLVLMTSLTRILLIAQVFFLISNFLTGMLQVHQVFIIPALSPIVYNIFIILSIFILAPTMGIYGVAIGSVVGAFFHLAIQIPTAKAMGVKYRFEIKTQLAGVKEVIRLMLPRSLSLGLGEIENTVTLFFASSLAAGSISLLNLAMQLMYLPSRIFGTTVGQASLPILSKNIARNELDLFRDTVRKTISQSLFIAVPITVLVLVHRLAIIRIAFGTRQFPWAATLLTAKTLAYLTPAIVCQAVIQILVRAFYAIHDTKTPLKVSFFSLAINISSAYFLINYTDLGILGLAISASLGNLTQCLGLFYLFIKTVDGAGWQQTYWHYFKILLASFILGLTSWVCVQFFDLFVLDTSRTINLIILSSLSVLISIFVYYFIAIYLQISEIYDYQHYFGKLTRFFKR
ncbi:MAG: murein biosynthesis integral membrane protein MurJ [Microgenomates group bacterium]